MQVETIAHQATLDGVVLPVKRNRFDRPLADIRLIVERAQVHCDWCDRLILPRIRYHDGYYHVGRRWAAHYDSPWDEEPRWHFYCGEECQEHSEDSSYSSWSYQYCDHCERYIVERCPSNGWHEYFRYTDDDEAICLRCYEEDIVANGQPDTDFDGATIGGGMFFSGGNPELVEAGYERLTKAFIDGGNAAYCYNDMARAYLRQGYQLVTAFESMAIGGLEGSIELWGKRKGE